MYAYNVLDSKALLMYAYGVLSRVSMSVQNKIDTVRTMAETIVRIANIDVPRIHTPEVDFPEEMSPENMAENIANGEVENLKQVMDEHVEETTVEITEETVEDLDIEGAGEWWDAWCEIRGIIDEAFEDDVEGGDSVTLTDHEQFDTLDVRNESMTFRVDVYASGEVEYITEYTVDEEANLSAMLYEGSLDADGLDHIRLGREVARAELALIINTTNSAAETLDYWQSEMGYTGWSQKAWADARGVGRQTVNDRVRSAAESLNDR